MAFLFLIAIFIICIAWINYINLATARSVERAKEVGVRKVLGALRSTLIRQFLMENSLEWKALATSEDAFPPVDREAVRNIRVPVLLMSGENSLASSKLITAELARLLPGAATVTLQGATHEMWAEQPEACRKQVESFFVKH